MRDTYLEKDRFSVSDFHWIPRAYDVFFEKSHVRCYGAGPMSALLTAPHMARRDLEAADSGTKISEKQFGYMALKRSNLHEDEQTTNLPRVGETFEYEKIASMLGNLFPNASAGRHRHAGRGPPPPKGRGRRWIKVADAADHNDYEDEPPDGDSTDTLCGPKKTATGTNGAMSATATSTSTRTTRSRPGNPTRPPPTTSTARRPR